MSGDTESHVRLKGLAFLPQQIASLETKLCTFPRFAGTRVSIGGELRPRVIEPEQFTRAEPTVPDTSETGSDFPAVGGADVSPSSLFAHRNQRA
ncbi:hypothetical protein RRG08_033284 [Elysia crispata]|uniref:Uncharacterized protein n=1 Tax=Elysia crispata TaxID=231223 RepID=A0AAE0XRB3_9GAST|nr:hypothetical protein RRG08_033284 [Elysia crispata]